MPTKNQNLVVNSFDELVRYDQALFVNRREVNNVEQWVLGQDQSNRYFIIAPPGSGKTWLLKSLEERLSSKQKNKFIVLWLNLPEFFLPKPRNDKLVAWFKEVCAKIADADIEQDNTIREKLEQINSEAPIEIHINTLNQIFEWCTSQHYVSVIIVEEADEFGHYTSQGSEVLGRALDVIDRLRPDKMIFTLQTLSSTAGQKSSRGSSHHEQLYLITRPLKNSNSGDFRINQFQMLAKKVGKSCSLEQVRLLFDQLKPYRWDNPLANNFLFYSFIQKDFQTLDQDNIRHCCKKLLEIIIKRCYSDEKQPPIDIDQCFEALKRWASRKPQALRSKEPSSRDLDPYWLWLRSHGYLEYDPKKSNTNFFLISSLNSLLYALKEFEKRDNDDYGATKYSPTK